RFSCSPGYSDAPWSLAKYADHFAAACGCAADAQIEVAVASDRDRRRLMQVRDHRAARPQLVLEADVALVRVRHDLDQHAEARQQLQRTGRILQHVERAIVVEGDVDDGLEAGEERLAQ